MVVVEDITEATQRETPAQDAAPQGVKPAETKQVSNGEQQVQAKSSEYHPAAIFGLMFLTAVVLAVIQQSNALNGGDPMRWYNSLFAEHKVPPPAAHDSVCTIQFCQS
mmetsp:Transcript_27048/g.58898  ORF Transcript_27048/g.58898 Transcript_27048/m.58898 type:complete len:108 (+) Transcript_27048:111-434(+)